MNYDLKIEKIKEQILKNKLEFTNEEKFFISNNKDLKNIFFDILNKSPFL